MISGRITESEPESWDKVVALCDGGPLHLPGVHLAAHKRESLRFLVFRDEADIVACGLGLATTPRLASIRQRKAELTLPSPLAVRSQREAVMPALLETARLKGYGKLVVGPTAGVSFMETPTLAPFVTRRTLEFVIDLRRTKEEILKAMTRVHRKNIRRAGRAGLEVVRDTTREGLFTLRSMQIVAAERSRQRGGGFLVKPKSFFADLHEHVFSPGVGELWMARRGGESIAAIAYLGMAKRAITVRSGSTSTGYETRAMYLLLASVIERAQDRGFHELNLGGVPEEASEPGHPEHGLYDFKKGFGGRPNLCTELTVDLGSYSRD